MARTVKKDTKPAASKEPKQRWRPSDNQRWVVSFVMFFFSLFALASIISFYFTWSDDQMGGVIHNVGGPLGYKIGHTLVGDWFGLCSLCLPVVVIILSIRLLLGNKNFAPRMVSLLLSAMILGSISLGGIFSTRWAIFGSGLGGKMGIDVAAWLMSHIGRLGLGLGIFMGWILWAVFLTRRTITVVNSVAHRAVDILRPKRGKEEAEYDNEKDEMVAEEDTEEAPYAPFNEPAIIVSDEDDYVAPQEDGNDDNVVVMTNSGEEEDIIIPADEEYAPIEVSPQEPAEEEDDVVVVATATEENEDDGIEVIHAVGGMEGLPANSAATPAAEEEDVQLGTGGIVADDGEGNIQIIKTEHNDQEVGKIGSLYDPTRELSRYQRPPVEILEKYDDEGVQFSREEIDENKELIQQTLGSFGIKIKKIIATIGPTVTLYEIEPEMGVKAAKIKGLEDDIAISLKAKSIRLIVPMPGRGTIGIEIPNRNRRTVSMYSMMRSAKFQESKYELPIALGKTIQNETFVIDLAKMPHMLVAGATGQGKSVGLNVIINSLIYKKHPAELKFVMVDPKKVELSLYAKLEKHFLAKMESEDEAILTDTQRVVYTLNSLCNEMQARYELLRTAEVRKISEYNKKFLERRLNPNKGHRYLPYIVVVIDEFADMIMTAGKEVETPIVRLGQLARAVGIHLIIATQRPDVKVITGLIKANCPSRIAFKVTSMIDSRTILDQPGANKLIGTGDMLVSINGETTRLQCAFIDTPEIERITDFVAKQKSFPSAYLLPDYVPENSDLGGDSAARERVGDLDDMFEEVARFVVGNQQGSTSFVQRKFKLGYTRAARIMDDLESMGIVGPANGSKPREVLIADPSSLERILNDIFIENL